MKIGVLALQGDFDAHRKRLKEMGAEVVLIKKPEQLDEIDGLVIPGGESGTFLKLLGENGFAKPGAPRFAVFETWDSTTVCRRILAYALSGSGRNKPVRRVSVQPEGSGRWARYCSAPE
jgi:5'-phosphate synthase pdxT subunit